MAGSERRVHRRAARRGDDLRAERAARKRHPTPSPTGTPPRHVFPVRAGKVAYHPTHSAYPGTDVFADCGTPVVAVTDGRVLEVSRVDRFDKRGPLGPLNGGLSVSLLGDDGVRYSGSHLSAVATGIDPGVRVRAGQALGEVGHTGNANNVCHLHFGVFPECQGHDDWWIRRGVIWPAPYLNSWRKGRQPRAGHRGGHLAAQARLPEGPGQGRRRRLTSVHSRRPRVTPGDRRPGRVGCRT